MGIIEFLTNGSPRSRKKPLLDEDRNNNGVFPPSFLHKLGEGLREAERYKRSVYDYDPAGITIPDAYPHGRAPPPGKYGWVHNRSDPFKKKKQS